MGTRCAPRVGASAVTRVAALLLALLHGACAARSPPYPSPWVGLHQHRHKAPTLLEGTYPHLHLGRHFQLHGSNSARDADAARQEDGRALEAFYGRELPDQLNKMKKQAENAHEDLKRAEQAAVPSAIKKPVMNQINIIRTHMCWQRPNLPEHTKCLKFLGIVCAQESTGEGICTKFRKLVKDSCKEGGAGVDQKTMCSLKKQMFEEDEEDEEKEAELESAEEAVDEDEAKDEGADADGDGVPDSKDAFPQNPLEWADSDGDGVGDNSDAYPNDPSKWTKEGDKGTSTATAGDSDGDGVPDAEDPFPDDKAESKDTDGDGIGDNADPDIDGDGTPDDKDKFPLDKKEWVDLDGDGVGDNSDPDVDGDGHPSEKDHFPRDKSEWADLDGDGVGDNSSPDIDGDGHNNEKDKFPRDPNECCDLDGDGVGDNSDPDIDGDGRNNENDAFPRDPKEWLDSDGDGVGDNADAYPFDPSCHSPTEPCDSSDASVGTDPWKGGPITDPGALNKVIRHLPAQGFHGEPVRHEDGDTVTADWAKEWPSRDETESESIERTCKEHPDNTWCIRYHKHRRFAR